MGKLPPEEQRIHKYDKEYGYGGEVWVDSLMKEKGARICVEKGVEQCKTNCSKLKWQATTPLPLLLGQTDI